MAHHLSLQPSGGFFVCMGHQQHTKGGNGPVRASGYKLNLSTKNEVNRPKGLGRVHRHIHTDVRQTNTDRWATRIIIQTRAVIHLKYYLFLY